MACSSAAAIVAADVQRCRRRPRSAHAGAGRSWPAERGQIRAGDRPGRQVRPAITSSAVPRARSLPKAMIRQPVAALRLVHVVRGDQEGQAVARRGGGFAPRNRGAPSGPRRRSARRAGAASGRGSGRRRGPGAASSRRKAGRPAGSAASASPSRSRLSAHGLAAVRAPNTCARRNRGSPRCSGPRKN